MFGGGLLRGLVNGYRENDFGNLAAALSYRVFVVLFPSTILLAAISSLVTHLLNVSRPAERLVGTIAEAAPSDVSALLQRQLEAVLSSPGGFTLAFGIISSAWTGALAVNASIKALNRIKQVEETRRFLRRWATILALTAGAGILLATAFFGFIALQISGPSLAESIGLGRGFPLMTAVGWPAIFFLVVAAVTLLYRFGPAQSTGGWVTVGGLAFGLAWLVGNAGFLLYFNNFASYNETYGTLGGALALVLWIYIGSMAFLLGAQIDVLLAHGESRDSRAARRNSKSSAQPKAAEQRLLPEPARSSRQSGVLLPALVLFVLLVAVSTTRGDR